jgi:class 3 adenylate cyclase
MVPHGVRAPDGEVAIVFSDITRAASLWEHDPAAMRDATAAHNDLLRSLATKYGGYEGGVGRERNTGEGSFCLVFVRAFDALRWCVEAQNALLAVAWPESLLSHPGAAEEVDGGMDERTVFRGLRVRMGVHVGHPRVVKDAMTRRVEYVGSAVNTAARMTALAHGGQVVVSQQVSDKLVVEVTAVASTERLLTELTEEKRLKKLGRFEMPDMVGGATLYEMKVPGLEGRYFGRMALQKGYGDNDNSNSVPPFRPTAHSRLLPRGWSFIPEPSVLYRVRQCTAMTDR